MCSPLQEGPVSVRHHPLLSMPDEVSLLFVGDGPALLDLTQLLQPVVKTLRGEERLGLCFRVRTAWNFSRIRFVERYLNFELTLNLSFITCRSLSFSWRKERLQLHWCGMDPFSMKLKHFLWIF